MINTILIENNDEKVKFMIECDSAFERAYCNSESGKYLMEKICNNAIFIGSYYNHEKVGYCAVYMNDNSTFQAYITMIATRNEYQKMGIGQSLMDLCFVESKKRMMNTIKLEVSKNNDNAIKFYRKNGFEFIELAEKNESFFMIKML